MIETFDSRPPKNVLTDTIIQILIDDYFLDGKKIFALTENGRIYYLNGITWQLFVESPTIKVEEENYKVQPPRPEINPY